MSIKLYKELYKLVIFLYSKIFVFKELFFFIITITIIKIININEFLIELYLDFTIIIKVYFITLLSYFLIY